MWGTFKIHPRSKSIRSKSTRFKFENRLPTEGKGRGNSDGEKKTKINKTKNV